MLHANSSRGGAPPENAATAPYSHARYVGTLYVRNQGRGKFLIFLLNFAPSLTLQFLLNFAPSLTLHNLAIPDLVDRKRGHIRPPRRHGVSFTPVRAHGRKKHYMWKFLFLRVAGVYFSGLLWYGILRPVSDGAQSAAPYGGQIESCKIHKRFSHRKFHAG